MVESARESPTFAHLRQDGVWQATLAAGTAVMSLVVFGLLFPKAALGAVRVWWISPTFNYCILILPLSLYMLWDRRASLFGTAPAPNPRAALVVLALVVAWLGASEARIVEAQQFVVVSMVQATLWGALGSLFYRKLAAPFLYLYFLVPSGAYLIPALQSLTARFAVAGLHLLGIPVFSNGAVIEIPAGTFAVAEACAGLRFLVAAVAFGVFFAVITYRSWWRRLAFVALSIVVPILANGIRVLGLIAAAQWLGNPAEAMADHILYGWVFFSFVLIILILIGYTFSDQAVQSAAVAVTRNGVAKPPNVSRRIANAAVACFLAAASGPAAAAFLQSASMTLVPADAPRVDGAWRESSASDWVPIVSEPARSFRQSFLHGPNRIDRFIALYAGRHNNPARLNNKDADEGTWSFDSARQAILTAGHLSVPVRESVWLRGHDKRFVWSFYAIDGQVASSVWRAKWNQFLSYLTRANCLSAYVALSAQGRDEASAANAAGALLDASEDLNSYLCGHYQRPKASNARKSR